MRDGRHAVAATATATTGRTASSSVTVTVRNAVATREMTVSSIAYSLSGRHGADLNVTINVASGSGTPQANAYVWAYLYRNGRVCMTPTGATNASGSVTFKLIRPPPAPTPRRSCG